MTRLIDEVTEIAESLGFTQEGRLNPLDVVGINDYIKKSPKKASVQRINNILKSKNLEIGMEFEVKFKDKTEKYKYEGSGIWKDSQGKEWAAHQIAPTIYGAKEVISENNLDEDELASILGITIPREASKYDQMVQIASRRYKLVLETLIKEIEKARKKLPPREQNHPDIVMPDALADKVFKAMDIMSKQTQFLGAIEYLNPQNARAIKNRMPMLKLEYNRHNSVPFGEIDLLKSLLVDFTRGAKNI